MKQIRENIRSGTIQKFRDEFVKNYYNDMNYLSNKTMNKEGKL